MRSEIIIGSFLIFGTIITLFLIGRELVCWYFKINKRVEILEEQNELLKKIHNELEKTY
tara:strand:- start:940 stop:1116 length:177 start_codon:yes stop_codon:yes gene_type:complete